MLNKARASEVMRRLGTMGLSQALICDPLSIWYLTGYYTEPYERFLALYLTGSCNKAEGVLFANYLFPDATTAADRLVLYSDADDPIALVAGETNHGQTRSSQPTGCCRSWRRRLGATLPWRQARSMWRARSSPQRSKT